MAPVPVPNPAFISPWPILPGTMTVTVTPNGFDDWDNRQFVFNALANKPNAKLKQVAGTYYQRYQLNAIDFSGSWEAPNPDATINVLGTPGQRMQLLDAADQPLDNPTGVPRGLLAKQSLVGGSSLKMTVKNMSFETTPVKGYDGFSFYSGPDNNVGVVSILGCMTKHAQQSIIDLSKVLVGLAATSFAVDAGPNSLVGISFDVYSALHGTGTLYVEGVDYVLDRAARTIARLGGSAIPNGGTVYLTFNNTPNQLDVGYSEFSVLNCRFKGHTRYLPNGAAQPNVDSAIHFWGGDCHYKDPVVSDLFHNIMVTELPAYADLIYSPEGNAANFLGYQPSTPVNGKLRVENCVYEDIPVNVWAQNVEGRPAAGPYVFEPATSVRSAVTVQQNASQAPTNAENAPVANFDQSAATDFVLNNNQAVLHDGIILLGAGQTYGPANPVKQARLTGWVGLPTTNMIADNNGQLVEASFFGIGLFLRPPLQAGVFALPPPIDLVEVLRNVVAIVQKNNFSMSQFKNGAIIDHLANVIFRDQVFSNVRKTGNAVEVFDTATVQMSGNNFAGWQLIGSAVDIHLDPFTTGCVITALKVTDLICNEAGAANTIIGGTVVPC